MHSYLGFSAFNDSIADFSTEEDVVPLNAVQVLPSESEPVLRRTWLRAFKAPVKSGSPETVRSCFFFRIGRLLSIVSPTIFKSPIDQIGPNESFKYFFQHLQHPTTTPNYQPFFGCLSAPFQGLHIHSELNGIRCGLGAEVVEPRLETKFPAMEMHRAQLGRVGVRHVDVPTEVKGGKPKKERP